MAGNWRFSNLPQLQMGDVVRSRCFSAAFRDFNVRNLFVDVGSFDSVVSIHCPRMFFFFSSSPMLPILVVNARVESSETFATGRACIDQAREKVVERNSS